MLGLSGIGGGIKDLGTVRVCLEAGLLVSSKAGIRLNEDLISNYQYLFLIIPRWRRVGLKHR